MIDPILPLSIAIAEGNGTYALFLGSGVSEKAGIPTGRKILENTIELLYKMENDTDKADEKEIKIWFNESKYKNWGYSEILKNLYPSKEDRRNFLEKFFLGRKPTDAHNYIAKMVKKNLIKCIITTNFDRLMEQVLDNKGISYDVVSSEEDLKNLKPREHSNCRIIKLHGDYQKSNIKNTEKELEQLEDELEKEFKEILNNYGFIVIGYSGSDNGVMDCFENMKNSRYTLYWQIRENLNERASELIKQKDGKIIERESADEFLEELSRKIEIFQTHTAGNTPEFLIQEIKEYIRNNDVVSFLETIKNQMKLIKKEWEDIYTKTDAEFNEKRDEDFEEGKTIVMDSFKKFESFIDIVSAIGLVLIEYRTKQFYEYLINSIVEIYELSDVIFERYRHMSYEWRPMTRYIPRATIHNLYYYLGALSIKNENFDFLTRIFRLKITINDLSRSEIESKEIWRLISGSNIATFDRNSSLIFEYLLDSYNHKEFLKEFFRSHEDFLTYIYQFNFILCLYSIKELNRSVYPHSAELDDYDIRLYLEPFLFKIKTNNDFHKQISVVFGDTEGIPSGVDPKFIENYPERCHKLNKIGDSFRFDDEIPCDFFNK